MFSLPELVGNADSVLPLSMTYRPISTIWSLQGTRGQNRDHQWRRRHNDESSPADEATLDVEMVTVLNYPLKNTYLFYNEQDGLFDESIQYVLDQGIKPGVITVSYGAEEAQVGKSQAKHLCSVAQKAAASGITILFTSGDNGVNGVQYSGESCSSGFNPTYPWAVNTFYQSVPPRIRAGAPRRPQPGRRWLFQHMGRSELPTFGGQVVPGHDWVKESGQI